MIFFEIFGKRNCHFCSTKLYITFANFCGPIWDLSLNFLRDILTLLLYYNRNFWWIYTNFIKQWYMLTKLFQSNFYEIVLSMSLKTRDLLLQMFMHEQKLVLSSFFMVPNNVNLLKSGLCFCLISTNMAIAKCSSQFVNAHVICLVV